MTHYSTLNAEDVVNMLEETEEQIEDDAQNIYVLHHPKLGIFLGIDNGLSFWSGLNTAGATNAIAFESPELALSVLHQRNLAGDDEMAEDVEVFAAPSSHWKDLEAIGLTIGDMAFNEPAVAYFATGAYH